MRSRIQRHLEAMTLPKAVESQVIPQKSTNSLYSGAGLSDSRDSVVLKVTESANNASFSQLLLKASARKLFL